MSDTMLHKTGLGGRPQAPDRQRVVALVGDPRAHSRTAALASALAVRLAREVIGGSRPDSAWKLIELSGWTHDRSVYDWSVLVQDADVLIVASPIKQGSFTGLLKSFLDILPDRALEGATAIPVTVARTPRHALSADVHLRPVLGELGASCPTPSLFALESRLTNPGAICGAWFARSGAALAHLRTPATG
ncbi:MAG TPA: NADPH-dependent FMN reductase [Solirubrobacterales bacterium]|nr:NADPH-dependent FMN reductase [Solirubrobacterales bacterium]